MNQVVLVGRLTKDVELNQSGKVAWSSLAVDRNGMKDQDKNYITDFINLRWLGEQKAAFAQKYLTKGTKIAVNGCICVDNYKDKDGNNKQNVYVMVASQEFCESKGANQQNTSVQRPSSDGFMGIPDGIENELPFQ